MSNFSEEDVFGFDELKLVYSKKFADNRGLFFEAFREDFFQKMGINFVQENVSVSKAGTVRGLHYQLNPKALGKLITCLSGSILDVAVDIRSGSPTYGKAFSIILKNDDKSPSVWVPRGFAHGFQALEDNTIVMYKQDEYYSPDHERSLNWYDPTLNINSCNILPILSEKDRDAPFLKDIETNFKYEKRDNWGI